MTDLQTALRKETWKHALFPLLLELVEDYETWEQRAKVLNDAGIRTYLGRPWTRQNIHQIFKSYWRDRNGRYSWKEHKHQLATVREALA